MGWRSKAEKAKAQHRPSLHDWACDRFHEKFPRYTRDILSLPGMGYQYCNTDGDTRQTCIDTIPSRLDAKKTCPYDFHLCYEAKQIPCVIENIPQGWDVHPSSSLKKNFGTNFEEKKVENLIPIPTGSNTITIGHMENVKPKSGRTRHEWKALEAWTLESLLQNSMLRERSLKCGEDDDGRSIRMKLKHFIRYLQNNVDDSPLYIFDSSFYEDRLAKRLLWDYRVPTYFNEDLFHLVGEKRRPPYRWFLLGPERSGTCIHIDPLATSAWNTLIAGKKRWVLFPPHVPKSVVEGKGLYQKKHEDDEAIHYFTNILPRIKKDAISNGNNGRYLNFKCYEFTQHESETIFIPNGWWHAVLNLTHTIGITQNFCSQRNFDQVWMKTREGRKKMAYKWLCKLDQSYPHLAKRARDLNKSDNFIMKYDPKEVERRKILKRKKI